MRIQMLTASRRALLGGVVMIVGSIALADAKPTPTANPSPSPSPRPAGGQSLTTVAKDKKLKTEAGDASGGTIVISNENLAEYAAKGAVTEAKPARVHDAVGPKAPGVQMVDPESLATDQRKMYWQQKYVQQLSMIQSLKRQIKQLDRDIPGLWNDYYARDDPAYRDGVIKPRLDSSLKRRDELEAQLASQEPKLQQIKDDARRDGAEPGWFRELKLPTPPKPKEEKPAVDMVEK